VKVNLGKRPLRSRQSQVKISDLNDLNRRALKVNLTTGGAETVEIEPGVYQAFLGGRGLNQYYLYMMLKPESSPLAPETPFLLGSGLLSGTSIPGATRVSIDTRNYFSNGVGSANAADGFSSALKRAGYGMIIVIGRARDPVFLRIEDGIVQIQDAKELWGKTVPDTVDWLNREMGGGIQVACIGPAGENGVRGASVMVNKSRAAGKCGVGAIMGSKNLKAIVVRGTGRLRVARPREFDQLRREAWLKVKRSTASTKLSAWGTKVGIRGKNAVSAVAFRHFQDGSIASLNGIDENAFAPYEKKRFHCNGCPVSCRQEFRIDDGLYAGTQGESIQCNTIQDFGTKLDIHYAPAIIKAHLLCNEYGMDIDMVGESVAWAFECYEKGILTEGDSCGLPLSWGNHEVLITLIHQIANRQGIGDILAEGVKKASEMIGQGSQELAVSMKGQDLYEDMRIPKGYALGAALSTRGGGHCSGSPLIEFSSSQFPPATYEGKAALVAYFERFHSVVNSLGVCFFVTVWQGPDLLDEQDLAGLVRAGTGWDVEASELMEAGERIHTLERLFNAAYAGFDRKNDYPPERFFREPIKSGPFRGEIMDREAFDRMLDRNYEIHGWSEQGLPRMDTLDKLGLTKLVKDSLGAFRSGSHKPA
jgi:aldehyde:ferredoxin oxidoreductase